MFILTPKSFTPVDSPYPLNSRLILIRGIVVRFTAREGMVCPMQGIRPAAARLSLISVCGGGFCARSIGTARSHVVPA
jgi:hypothetical protein